jgi:hypothetical protein
VDFLEYMENVSDSDIFVKDLDIEPVRKINVRKTKVRKNRYKRKMYHKKYRWIRMRKKRSWRVHPDYYWRFWNYHSKFFKDYANRKVRMRKYEVYNRCLYKRVFDYWWTIL